MRDDRLSLHVDHMLPFLRASEAAMASTTIRAVWDQARFEYENKDTTTSVNLN
jgi:hypothetical protein